MRMIVSTFGSSKNEESAIIIGIVSATNTELERSSKNKGYKSRCRVRNKLYKLVAVSIVLCMLVTGCGRTSRKPTATSEPNASVTYEKGRDFVGVIKSADHTNKKFTFYNTAFEEEVIYEYSGGTEILTKNGKQISSQSLEVGQVVDVYLNQDTKKISRLQLSGDILEYENVEDLVVNTDESYLEINEVRYKYGSGFTVFSNGEPVDIKEIAKTDEVTFRGIKGKAYSLVVTRGHGYIKPEKYNDFIGGTLTVGGVMIIPVTEKMLVPVPEGAYEITMKNGDFIGSREVQVERDKQFVLDMSLYKSTVANMGQVVFDIDPVGAELYVNGSLTDYSRPVSLKYGKHMVKVVLDGYTSYAGVVDVQSANPTVRISLADEEAEVEDESDDTSVSKDESADSNSVSDKYDQEHKITVNTPAGASVYLDGTYKGKAPCSFSKKIGSVTITLSMDGHTTKSYTVTTIDDDKDVQWSFPDLESTAVG